MAAENLCELLLFQKLRLPSQILLQVPMSQLKSYGHCAFNVAPPLCGIDCRQILEMCRLLICLNLF